jgi:AcrR family transcriptional regulator
MIGHAAGVNHPLVAYYFSSKAALFEEVLADVCEEYYKVSMNWFDEISQMKVSSGLPIYIERIMEFTEKHPEAARILLLNMVQSKESDAIPSYQMLQKLYERVIPLFLKFTSAKSEYHKIEMFHHNFNTLISNYLGAGAYYAGILGLDPHGPEYKQWVRENMVSLFLPLLKRLILGINQDRG